MNGKDVDTVMAFLRTVASAVDDDHDSRPAVPVPLTAGESPVETLLPRSLVNYADVEGRTALHWALALGNWPMATQLLNAPFCASPWTVDSFRSTPLIAACAAKAPVEVLQLLLSVAALPVPGQQQAAAGGRSGADLLPFLRAQDEAGNTALMSAVSRKQMDAVTLLLNADTVAMETATAAALTSAGAEPPTAIEPPTMLLMTNRNGQTVLHRAVGTGSEALCAALISQCRKLAGRFTKKFVNAQDRSGDTALHHAAMENHRELGELLLRNGAERETRNKAGRAFYEV